MNGEGTYLYKTSCEACGSSDGNCVYSDGNTHCFVCGVTVFNKDNEKGFEMSNKSDFKKKEFNPSIIEYPSSIRNITETTLRKFSYGINKDLGKHVAYMYNTKNEIVAEKYRGKDKEFGWSGNAKQASLFGQNLWKPNKKISITITEGEIDAMSTSQMQGNKYPVVSVTCGANSAHKEIKKQLEWLLGFKEVVLCFDNDKVGQQAAEEVASLFPPKFVRIANLPLKDANEMLKNNRSQELSAALRDAKFYTPDGILSGLDVLEALENEKGVLSYLFPPEMEGLNNKLKGIRLSELMVITAGSGAGKSAFIKQLQEHYFLNTDMNQALIHLEEPLVKTAKDLIGLTLGTRLQLDGDLDKSVYMHKAKELFGAVDGEGYSRFCLYDSFGSIDSEDLYNKIRFLVKGLNCKIIWLDHLSILVSDLGQGTDERRAIDSIMHNLKSLTIELGCFIGLVSHTNNDTKTPFENGGEITINNLRGSGSIKQLSDSVIALSRNQQAEEIGERNTVKVSVLKNRYTGDTGLSCRIFYNYETGRFQKSEGEYETTEMF